MLTKKIKILSLAICGLMTTMAQAQTTDSLTLHEVVVTGTRHATDVRHLPMTVTVIGREQLTEQSPVYCPQSCNRCPVCSSLPAP